MLKLGLRRLSGALTGRQRQVAWRCRTAGILELEAILGSFTKYNIHRFDDQQLNTLEKLLGLPGWDFFELVAGKQEIPNESNPQMDMLREIRDYVLKD